MATKKKTTARKKTATYSRPRKARAALTPREGVPAVAGATAIGLVEKIAPPAPKPGTITDAQLEQEFQAFLREGLAITKGDYARSARAMKQLMLDGGIKNPKFTQFESLPAAIDEYRKRGGQGVPAFCPGQLFIYWASDCDVARRYGLAELTPEELRAVDLALDLARGAWWMIPFEEGDCFACRPPTKLNVDENTQFHSDIGPAIAWADGRALYAWHGIWVPEEWVMRKDQVDPALVFDHPNLEQARALGELLGWGRVLEKVPTRVLDKDRDPQVGELLGVTIRGNERRFVRAKCGTGRTFVFETLNTAKTALEGNAATWGVTPEQYRQLRVRT